MTATVVPVPIGEKPALARFVAAYVVEMSAIVGLPQRDGTYPRFDLYWSEPDSRWPFWLTADGTRAGFALVRRDEDVGWTEMAEFFVAPEHRLRGIGIAAARGLIARHPGPWQITQRETNTGAIAFWHRVLDGFVSYEETTTRTDAVRREQHFVYP